MTCIGVALVTRGKSQQILKLCKEQTFRTYPFWLEMRRRVESDGGEKLC